jgi:hypothetical protein
MCHYIENYPQNEKHTGIFYDQLTCGQKISSCITLNGFDSLHILYKTVFLVSAQGTFTCSKKHAYALTTSQLGALPKSAFIS